jgi:hypothetical protein
MVSRFRMIFRRTLKEGEEREESDVWSSSVPDVSDSEAGSIHSGDERSVDLDHIADSVSQEELSAAGHDKLQETGNEELE